MAEWIEGRVVRRTHWTENLFSLNIDAPVAPFNAGQFTSLALDLDGESVARPYSFLSPPHERPVEFYFHTVRGGRLSEALARLGQGDTVRLRKHANGYFILQEVPAARDLWMLGTGTGIAPYLSILRTEEPWQRFERIVFVRAVRKAEDLQYADVIREISAAHPGQLSVVDFVSRESVEGALSGRIPPAIEDGSLERQAGIELSTEYSQIMMCGNPDMVKDAGEVLKARGFEKNRRRKPGHITTENYW